jgi:membrane-bound lytic murein transglycosylase D
MCRRVKILKKIAFLLLLALGACESKEAIGVSKETENTAFWAEIEKIDKQEIKADLWRYISSKHTLKVRSQKDLYWHIKWFKENPDYLERVTKRAGAYFFKPYNFPVSGINCHKPEAVPCE